MARSTEPLWWALFSGGGMLSAMFLPVLIVVTGILIPFGLASVDVLAYDRVYGVLGHPIVRLILFPVLSLPFFHWAHRFFHTLVELGLRRWKRQLAVLCYGLALVATFVAAFILWRL
jgi:fumarate reductase subunit D